MYSDTFLYDVHGSKMANGMKVRFLSNSDASTIGPDNGIEEKSIS